jgi:hypothetical protein
MRAATGAACRTHDARWPHSSGKSRGATYCDRLAALPRIGKQMRRTTFEIEADELKEKQRMEPP